MHQQGNVKCYAPIKIKPQAGADPGGGLDPPKTSFTYSYHKDVFLTVSACSWTRNHTFWCCVLPAKINLPVLPSTQVYK